MNSDAQANGLVLCLARFVRKQMEFAGKASKLVCLLFGVRESKMVPGAPGCSPHGCATWRQPSWLRLAFSVRHAVCMVMPSVAWKMSAVYVVLYADGPSGVVRTFPVSVATRGSLRAYNAAGMKDPYSRGLSRATATKELVLLGTRA